MSSLLTRIKAAAMILAGYHGQEWSPNRQWRVARSQSNGKDIPYGVRRKMVDWSREMERRDPLFNRFLDLCEQYIIGSGLRVASDSNDREWAQRANNEWETWQPYCDVASRFSFGQRQALIEREIEVAGEVFIFLTYGSSGKPRIQLIESESVETPPALATQLDIKDGVRVEPNGRALSYFFRTETADGKPSWEEIDASRVVHMGDPSRIGQTRYLPIIYPVLKDMIDIGELQDFEMSAAKDASHESIVIKTATGERPAADLIRERAAISNLNSAGAVVSQTKDQYYEEALAGARRMILQRGDSAEQFKSDRPSVAVQSFWDFVQAREAAGMGLPIEILIMRSLQGTMARGAFEMANGFFRCKSYARAEQFGRIWEHVIGSTTSLRKGKGLPGDWRKTKATPPKAINVDVGRNSAALIAEWEQGFWALDDIVGPYGKTGEEIIRQRCRDYKLAREIETEEGVPLGVALPLPLTNEQPTPDPQLANA